MNALNNAFILPFLAHCLPHNSYLLAHVSEFYSFLAKCHLPSIHILARKLAFPTLVSMLYSLWFQVTWLVGKTYLFWSLDNSMISWFSGSFHQTHWLFCFLAKILVFGHFFLYLWCYSFTLDRQISLPNLKACNCINFPITSLKSPALPRVMNLPFFMKNWMVFMVNQSSIIFL